MSGYGRYLASYNPNLMHQSLEYPGYNSELVLGRRGDISYYGDDDYYSPSYPNSRSYQYYSLSPSRHYSRPYLHPSEHAYLQWTEVPLTLSIALCCQDCKHRLGKSLRKIHGVHEVDIKGWSPARVTVTGFANPHKILRKARKVSKTAHWMDSQYGDTYYIHDNRHKHWWNR